MKKLYVTDREKWRQWLAKHGESETELWLIFYRKGTGKPSIPYDDAVEEALCYGWIDSTVRKLDDSRYARKFTPRKDNSVWSPSNKKRAKAMIAQKRMTPTGMARIEAARKSGKWQEADKPREPTPMPEELAAELKKSEIARVGFEKLTPSHQRHYLEWVGSAKKPETRRRRAAEAVEKLAAGVPLGLK